MKVRAPASFGAQLKGLRESAGFTQEELATIAGLSVHAVSALERGHRRRPHVETVRALSAALDLSGATRDAFLDSARGVAAATVGDELLAASLPLTALVGRDADLGWLYKSVADPAARLITILGPGGVGKTRLALELAHTIARQGTTAVVFVPLAALRESAFVAPAIAEALGLTDVSALDLPARAGVACGDQPTLLVLDNFEHVQPAAPLIGELLSRVRPLRMLVTSRSPLHVRGEREYALEPLELDPQSEGMSPADLAHVPAVRLFVERARDVQPDFCLTPANAPTVAAICRKLDALPLALELAARWIKALTLDDLLRRLERDRLVLMAGLRDLPERQQTMNSTVAWSYQLLDPQEQRAFRRLGALPGPFSIGAAEAVLAGREGVTNGDHAVWAVGTLIDKSLLMRSRTSHADKSPLYLMLETVRAYAALQLAADERDDALEGLARYCGRTAALASDGIAGPDQVEWLDRVREDLESYRIVLSWLIERGRSLEACQIAWGLMWFWAIRGHAIEGLRWYELIAAQPALAPAVESRVLSGAAAMRYIQGDLARARNDLLRALALAHGSRDTEAVHAEWILGYVEYAAGDLAAARASLEHAVTGFHAHASAIPWGMGQALSGLAWIALAEDDPDRARHLLADARVALRDAGPWFLSLVEYLSAVLAVRRGEPDEAIALIRESLIRMHQLKDKFAFVYALIPLAAAAAAKGDYEWAARIIGARDAVSESTGVTIVDDAVRELRESTEREARARLGPRRWGHAYAAGRKTSTEMMLHDIDSSRS